MEAAAIAGAITAVIVLIILFCWFGRKEVLQQPIRFFAVMCVAITSAYIMWMGYHLTTILASPDWCGKALQASRISTQNFGGLTACVDLLKIQLKALAENSLIYAGVIALCLLVLIVIVIAGAKLSGDFGKDGARLDLAPGGDPLPVRVEQPKSRPVPVTPTPAPAVPPAAPPTAPPPE